jgi:riboflavin synthase
MFTGIIENTGTVQAKTNHGSNLILTIAAANVAQKLGESIAINGACLTVIKFDEKQFEVEAIPETLKLTNLGSLQIGDQVNLEKSLQMGSSLDGHFVLGHIDFQTSLAQIVPDGESRRLWFKLPSDYQKYIAKKALKSA